jgi:hypothetical protein
VDVEQEVAAARRLFRFALLVHFIIAWFGCLSAGYPGGSITLSGDHDSVSWSDGVVAGTHKIGSLQDSPRSRRKGARQENHLLVLRPPLRGAEPYEPPCSASFTEEAELFAGGQRPRAVIMAGRRT